MIPYTHHTVTPEDEAAVLRVLRSDHLTQGPEVVALEADLCTFTGAHHAIATSSGTVALELLYTALAWPVTDCPAITFMATASAAKRANTAVRFTDCDPQTGLCTDPHAEVFVTLGGQVPDRQYSIVDACHGPIAHWGRIATVLSFHPAKHVAAGEGGAVLTNKDGLAEKLRELRDAGRKDGRQVRLGTNGRMDEMSAALARSQLARYSYGVIGRGVLADRYDAEFAGVVETVPHTISARHLYQLLLDDRDAFRQRLAARGVGTQVHYRPVPSEPYWQLPDWRERFPGAARHADRTVSIPLYPSMTNEQVETVIRAVKENV